MEKEICEEDDTPFSGGGTLSHTNDGAQMESRKGGVRSRTQEGPLSFSTLVLLSYWRVERFE